MTTLVSVLQRWLEADFVCVCPSWLFLIKYLTSSQPRILFLSSFILPLQSQGADFPTYGTVTSLCAGFGKMLLPLTWDRIYGSRTGVQDLDFNLSTYSHFLSTWYLISALQTPVFWPLYFRSEETCLLLVHVTWISTQQACLPFGDLCWPSQIDGWTLLTALECSAFSQQTTMI